MGHAENGVEEIRLTEIPGEKYQKALEEIVEENCGSQFKDCVVKIDAASAKGDNYSGVLYRVVMKDSKDKELRIIVKLPPQNVTRRK